MVGHCDRSEDGEAEDLDAANSCFRINDGS